jgi:hypothetical protein
LHGDIFVSIERVKDNAVDLMFLWGRIKARFSSWNLTLLRLQRQGRSRTLMRARRWKNRYVPRETLVFLYSKCFTWNTQWRFDSSSMFHVEQIHSSKLQSWIRLNYIRRCF